MGGIKMTGKPAAEGIKWTKEEIKFLKENYMSMEYIEIAKKLGRTMSSVRNKRYKLDLQRKHRKWTTKEIEKIVKKYTENELRGNLDLKSLAKELNRNTTDICEKASELGLTSMNRSINDKLKDVHSKAQKEWYRNNDHPKGFLGKKHNEESKSKISKKSKASWNDPNSKLDRKKTTERLREANYRRQKNGVPKNTYTKARGGKRKDLNNQYLRSKWEANYARYLNYLGLEWEYEPKTFEFKEIKRGTRHYTPDFYIPKEDVFIEVKGWFTSKGETAIKRFFKYFPEKAKKLKIVLDKEFSKAYYIATEELGVEKENIESYYEIEKKLSGLIKNWEYKD
jgi:hypothetical protein